MFNESESGSSNHGRQARHNSDNPAFGHFDNSSSVDNNEADWVRAARQSTWAAEMGGQPAMGEAGGTLDPQMLFELRQMLADWVDLRSRGGISFIETRLDTIESFLSQLNLQDVNLPNASTDSPERIEDVDTTVPNEIEESNSSQTEDRSLPVTTEEDLRKEVAGRQPIPCAMLPDPPQAIDLDFATREELAVAVQERDAYIDSILLNLHALEAVAYAPVEVPELENLTDIQRGTIEIWMDGIRNELRQTQVQLSVERAQLSRDRMKLDHERQVLDMESKRRSITGARGVEPPAEPISEHPNSKSWLNLFGSK